MTAELVTTDDFHTSLNVPGVILLQPLPVWVHRNKMEQMLLSLTATSSSTLSSALMSLVTKGLVLGKQVMVQTSLTLVYSRLVSRQEGDWKYVPGPKFPEMQKKDLSCRVWYLALTKVDDAKRSCKVRGNQDAVWQLPRCEIRAYTHRSAVQQGYSTVPSWYYSWSPELSESDQW